MTVAAQEVRLDAPAADEDLQDSLRAASLSLTLEAEDANNPQDYVAAARADYRRLLTGLYAEGYYGGTISILVDGVEASRIDPLRPQRSVQSIVLSVDPGPRFTFGRTDIAPLAPGTELPDTFVTGAVAEADIVSDAARAAVDGWRNEGRPLAETTGQTITARHPDEALDVSITIDPGPQLRFGRVDVEGNEDVRTERVRAIAGLSRGIYDPEEIATAEANLRRTGAFASARITEAEAAEGGTLPLTIGVVEATPRTIGVGAEFSSVSGLTLSSYWIHRNLLGGAERLRLDAEVAGLTGGTGGVDYTLGAAFLRPATFRPDTDFYATANLSQEDEPSYFERNATLEAGIIRRLDDGVELEYGLGVSVGEVEDDLGRRSYQLIYAPIEGTIDRRDNELNAKSGYYANLLIAPFLGFDETDSGVRIVGDGRIYRSFGTDDRVTLAARGQVGSVLGADAANIPASYLFYSGGGGTVRGQPYQSLGVDLGGGDEIGGTTFLGAQLEARVNVTDTIGVVGFYDIGYVGAGDFDFSSGNTHSGAGLGLRYDTGIGPIRLDVGTPVSGDDAGGRIEVYLGIGQAF